MRFVFSLDRQAERGREPDRVVDDRELGLVEVVGAGRQRRLSHRAVRRRETGRHQEDLPARRRHPGRRDRLHVDRADPRTVVRVPGGR